MKGEAISISNGSLNVPDKPGSGAVVDESFLEKITIEKLVFKKNEFS